MGQNLSTHNEFGVITSADIFGSDRCGFCGGCFSVKKGITVGLVLSMIWALIAAIIDLAGVDYYALTPQFNLAYIICWGLSAIVALLPIRIWDTCWWLSVPYLFITPGYAIGLIISAILHLTEDAGETDSINHLHWAINFPLSMLLFWSWAYTAYYFHHLRRNRLTRFNANNRPQSITVPILLFMSRPVRLLISYAMPDFEVEDEIDNLYYRAPGDLAQRNEEGRPSIPLDAHRNSPPREELGDDSQPLGTAEEQGIQSIFSPRLARRSSLNPAPSPAVRLQSTESEQLRPGFRWADQDSDAESTHNQNIITSESDDVRTKKPRPRYSGSPPPEEVVPVVVILNAPPTKKED